MNEIKQKQLQSLSGKTFFTLFIISFIAFYSNNIIFTYFIYNSESISLDTYSTLEILSIIPYQVGKLAMTLFLILRLHFVFEDTTLVIHKWIIIALIISLCTAVVLGCISGIVGPLQLIEYDPDVDVINPAQLISLISVIPAVFVDIAVMIYYIQRLQKVTIMEGSITSHTRMRSKSGKGIKYVIELEAKKSGMKGTDSYVEHVTEKEVHIDAEFFDSMTKSTLLSLIGLCSTLWLYLHHLVMAMDENSDGIMFRAIACVDGAINLICLYLMFSFAKPNYDVGCRFCHKGMSVCCVWFAERGVLRKSENESKK